MKTTIKIEKLEISFESTEHPQQQGKAAEETSQRETAQASHNAKAEQNVNQEKKKQARVDPIVDMLIDSFLDTLKKDSLVGNINMPFGMPHIEVKSFDNLPDLLAEIKSRARGHRQDQK